MKVAINNYFGHFSLSSRAAELLIERGAGELLHSQDINREFKSFHLVDNTMKTRTNPVLIEVIEELGLNANGRDAALAIVDVDDDVVENAYIDSYNGLETVHEEHRIWNALQRPASKKMHGHDW